MPSGHRSSQRGDPGVGHAAIGSLLLPVDPSVDPVGTAVEELQAAARDLTSAARRIQDAALRHEQLFQLAPYLVTDPDVVIEEANAAAGEILDRDPGSVVGTPLLDLVDPGQRARLSGLSAAARAEPGRVMAADGVTMRLDDHALALNIRCRAVCDSDDRVAGFGWILEDVGGALASERRARVQQEQETERLRSQVQHWQRLESSASQYIGLASHELRTPVTMLAGYLSLLDEGNYGELSPGVDRVVGLLVTKTAELNDLIDDIVEAARLDDRRVALRIAPVDIGDVVGHLVEDWRPLGSPGQLNFVAPEVAVVAEADGVRLRNIINNLISNAMKYSPGGGPILSAVERRHETVVISVRDHGLGIAPEAMSTLFTRFGRIATPATRGLPGSGLGLYIARELARLHGGDLTATSALGEGSEFTVSLPLRQPVTP